MAELIPGHPAAGGLEYQRTAAGNALCRVLQILHPGDLGGVDAGAEQREHPNPPDTHLSRIVAMSFCGPRS